MDEEIREEYDDWLRDKARFCLLFRIAPSEYDLLTAEEREVFIEVHNELSQGR